MIFLLASAILATEPATAGYDVVRAGDRAMACPALIGEINAINKKIQDQQQQSAAAMNDAASDMMDTTALGVGGLAMTGLGSLASMVPGGSQALAMGRQAQMVVGQKRMMAQIDQIQRESVAMLPVQQRLEHLMQLYSDKGC